MERAATGLIEAGLTFLTTIAARLENRSSTDGPSQPVQEVLSKLVTCHPETNRPILSIPLPESFTQERLSRAVDVFLNALRPPS